MKKLKNIWTGFVGEISQAVSERDCKKYSALYAVVAVIMAAAGKKNKWYLLGTIIYGIVALALFQSYKSQRKVRYMKENAEELNEPVEK